ncbi:protein PLASTID MOVEMENT IMPAIRED 1-RELATED 2-like isoform X2 [Andrographis paniculata]|nr:protein PLASTID MOVEMENT IMPAIRED 1-RELATED 2-like isoform X2 [Andrographis paniculata]XP_051151351.1 protein PLASTID MOVEMENT IMPAIRED 1-RELATED 2-like isoform X2 [Andrographis paniculata]
MMPSKVDSRTGKDEDFNSEILLRDIEEISKALYLPPKTFNSSLEDQPSVTTITGNLESKSKVSMQSLSDKDKKSSIQSSSRKDKKSSIWNWKPLKALMHSRQHRISCCFFLHVHAVEGLSSDFNGLNLCVTWKQKGNMLRTRLVPVCAGITELEETLTHHSIIYAHRPGAHNLAKYEPKLFLLHTSVIDPHGQDVDIGNHWIDLTRLLPLTLEELGGDNRNSGKWTTCFKLSGKGEGAVLNVSFGFSVLDGNSYDPKYFVKDPLPLRDDSSIRMDHSTDFHSSRVNQLHKFGSVPTISTQESFHQSKGIKFIDGVILNKELELGKSISLLYQKLEEGKVQNSIEFDLFHETLDTVNSMSGGNMMHAYNDTGLNVVEHGVEVSTEDQVCTEQNNSQRFDSSLVEIINIADIFNEGDCFDVDVERTSKVDASKHGQNDSATDATESNFQSRSDKEPNVELQSDSCDMLTPRSIHSDPVVDTNKFYEQANCTTSKCGYDVINSTTFVNLDDVAESIENDFLKMLNIEQSPVNLSSGGSSESSSKYLLELFREDNTDFEDPIIDTFLMEEQDTCCLVPHGYDRLESSDDTVFSFSLQTTERKNHVSPSWKVRNGRNAKMLEYQETESLMEEWGLNEKAFRNSPRASPGGFGSPVYPSGEQPLKLPSLGDGLGSIIRTRDGGFLRSLNPLLFQNAINDAKLIVQVSPPIVLPAAMGFSATDILQQWASQGVERMSIQCKELMHLEDITGKTIQQVFSETKSGSDASTRLSLLHAPEIGLKSIGEKKASEDQPFINVRSSDCLDPSTSSEDMESEYVSIKNLVPLAIRNIEGLLIEGLKIQSGMQCKESPSNIWIQFSTNSGLQALDDDDLVNYAVTLEEWIRMDSGDFDGTIETDKNVLKVLAAHCAKYMDLDRGQLVKEDHRFNLLDGTCGGIFENNFTMVLKVQLRDPLRNYEMVGPAMLALVQVQRIYSPSQPGLQCFSPEKSCHAERVSLDDSLTQEGNGFQKNQSCGAGIPQFKVLNVHLAGLKLSPANEHLWGTSRQHQSGARWLYSSGSARTNRHPISTSNAIVKPSMAIMRKASQRDVLWSIAPPSQGEAVLWDDLVALNVHIRNPDIIFPSEASVYQQK